MRLPCPGRLVVATVAGLASAEAVSAQAADPKRDEFVRRKLDAVEQFASANQAKLRGYAWTETVRYLLNAEVRSTRRFLCRYAADGTIERTSVGPPAA